VFCQPIRITEAIPWTAPPDSTPPKSPLVRAITVVSGCELGFNCRLTLAGMALGLAVAEHTENTVYVHVGSPRWKSVNPTAFFGIYLGRGGRLGLECLLLRYFRVGDDPTGTRNFHLHWAWKRSLAC
jgi:hypothetical protein